MAKKSHTVSPNKKKAHNKKHIFVFVLSSVLITLMLWEVFISAAGVSAQRGRGKLCRNGRGSFFSFCKVGDAAACNTGCTCDPFNKKFKFGVCRGDGSKTPPIQPCKGSNSPTGKIHPSEGVEPTGKEIEPSEAVKNMSAAGAVANPCPSMSPKPSEIPHPSNKPSGFPHITPTTGSGGGGTGAKACGTSCTTDSDCASGFCNPSGFAICPTSMPGQPLEQCAFLPPDPTAPSVCAPITCRADNTNPANCACPAN